MQSKALYTDTLRLYKKKITIEQNQPAVYTVAMNFDRDIDFDLPYLVTTSSSSSLFGVHRQCIAPLAANSPHSGLSRAISIASS